MSRFFPAILNVGVSLIGPSTVPSANGQVMRFNTDRSFGGWLTAGDVIAGGKAGSQTLIGGTSSGERLTLQGNAAAAGIVAIKTGDSLELSSSNGADTIRVRNIGASPNRGFVITTNGVDRFFFNHDGQFQSVSLNTGATTCSGLSVVAANPALIVRRSTGANTARFTYQTSTTDDWYTGTKGTEADYYFETALGIAIRCRKSGLGVVMPSLPTSDPAFAGQLWNDGGTLKVSAG